MLLRVITQITTLCSFALAVPASKGILGPYGYGFDIGPLVKRQNEQPIVVSSLPAVNSSMPIRPEIRELKRNSRKWNLYILALSMMQHTDQDEELSWYQITGESFHAPLIKYHQLTTVLLQAFMESRSSRGMASRA